MHSSQIGVQWPPLMKRAMKFHEPSKVRNFVLSDSYTLKQASIPWSCYRWSCFETRSEICSAGREAKLHSEELSMYLGLQFVYNILVHWKGASYGFPC